MIRRLLAVVAALLLLGGLFVLYHRAGVRWPTSGDAIRAEARPSGTLETFDSEASVAELIELRNAEGAVTTAWLRTPRRLEADHEILITYVGHATGRKILDLVPERDDVVLVAMQYAAAYRRDTWRQKLALPTTIAQGVEETVVGGMLAVAELERRGFDRRRLTVLGVSVGTFFAVLHGAYDEAVPRVLIVHGGGDMRRVLESAYRARDKPWTGRLVGNLATLFLGPLDALHHVERIAPRPFTMIASRGDSSFPQASAAALYARARAPKAIAWTDGAHVRSKRLDIIEDLVAQISAYLDGELEFDQSEGMPVASRLSAGQR